MVVSEPSKAFSLVVGVYCASIIGGFGEFRVKPEIVVVLLLVVTVTVTTAPAVTLKPVLKVPHLPRLVPQAH